MLNLSFKMKIYYSLILLFIVSFYFYYKLHESYYYRETSSKEIISEALFQAISMEKLPEILDIINNDTIYAIVYQRSLKNNKHYLETMEGLLPHHIDNWPITQLDTLEIKKRSIKGDFYYITIILEKDENDFIVDIINDVESNHIYVDRGRLKLKYHCEKGFPKLVEFRKGFG